VKKYSTFLVIKEVQIKTTLRFLLTSIRMVVIKKTNKNNNKNHWPGCMEKGILINC
jgi:hypothetical protein